MSDGNRHRCLARFSRVLGISIAVVGVATLLLLQPAKAADDDTAALA